MTAIVPVPAPYACAIVVAGARYERTGVGAKEREEGEVGEGVGGGKVAHNASSTSRADRRAREKKRKKEVFTGDEKGLHQNTHTHKKKENTFAAGGWGVKDSGAAT